MHTNDVFPTRFVKAEDLDHEVGCTIDKVVMEEVFNPASKEKAMHPILYVVGGKKGVLINKTNWHSIADEYGPESDAWKGKAIVLYAREVSTPDGPQPAIRIKIPITVPLAQKK